MPCDFAVASRLTADFSVFTEFRFLDEVGKANIARALAEASISEEHAREIVSTWLKTEEEGPTPAQLWDLAKLVGAKAPQSSVPPPYCVRCEGTGRYSVWMLVDIHRRPSGEPFRQTLTQIPPIPGREAEYLVYRPRYLDDETNEIRWCDERVDDVNQRIGMYSVYCTCELGRQKRQAVLAREAVEKDAPVRRERRRRKGGDD